MDNFKYFSQEDAYKENNESLYSAIQRVYLKCGIKEDRERELRLTLSQCQKNIYLQLTDDEDPFFLYTLVITDDDFKTIKSQQSLRVDFDHFPRQFVKLLEQCKNDMCTQGPRFLLLLETKEEGDISRSTYLKIVETNLFKNLCHLELRINSGSDVEVKKLMALQIKKLKEASTSSLKELAQTSSRLNDCLQRLELKQAEGEKLHEQWEDEKRNMQITLHAEINKEKERLLSAKLLWQAEDEKRKQELQLKHEATLKSLEAQVVQLSAQNHMLFEKNCQGESTKRERGSQLEFLEKELNASQNEIATLKKQNSKLDLDYHERNKQANSLKLRVAVLEQELKDTTILLTKQQELVRNTNEQKDRLEEVFREKETALQSKQTSLKNLSDELMKANDILTKLQAELGAVRSKLRLRTQIVLEQERLLSNKAQELAIAEKKVMEMSGQMKEFTDKEKNLNQLLATANENVDAKDKQICNEQTAVRYLLRQLASAQSSLKNPLSSSATTPSTRPDANQLFAANYSFEQLAPFIYAGGENPPFSTQVQSLQSSTSNSAAGDSLSNPNVPISSKRAAKNAQTSSNAAGASAGSVSTAPQRPNILSSQRAGTQPHPHIASAYFPRTANSGK